MPLKNTLLEAGSRDIFLISILCCAGQIVNENTGADLRLASPERMGIGFKTFRFDASFERFPIKKEFI